VPDVGVAAGILQPRTPAVLRSERKTVEGTVIQAMAVGVTGLERNPPRKSLGQCRLQAIVVGTHKVLRLVDEAQIGEFGGVRANASYRIDHIDVAGAAQSVAVIANIADVQRKVVR